MILNESSLKKNAQDTAYNKIKKTFDFLLYLGYTDNDIIKMTIILPALYGYSIENIKEKIDFYNSIDMHELAVIDTMLLMQSTALSYARYEFYKEKGIDITINNYKKLFIKQTKFESQFRITKQELLEKYNYNKFIELKKYRKIPSKKKY